MLINVTYTYEIPDYIIHEVSDAFQADDEKEYNLNEAYEILTEDMDYNSEYSEISIIDMQIPFEDVRKFMNELNLTRANNNKIITRA